MRKTRDITGIKFNHLTAIEFIKKVNGQHLWLWNCDRCGNNKVEQWKAAVIAGQTK